MLNRFTNTTSAITHLIALHQRIHLTEVTQMKYSRLIHLITNKNNYIYA